LIVSEIKTLHESISCKYIVNFFDAYYINGKIRFLLEYMDLGSLDSIYKEYGKFPENVLSEISFQVFFFLMKGIFI
jgi:serine/threonine protein kinase